MNISEIKFNLLQQKIELLKVLKKIEENKPLRRNFFEIIFCPNSALNKCELF